jgi:hypothetical protein
MQGYEVLTSDGERAGTVVDMRGTYVIVEDGAIFKHRRALPGVLATVDENERIVRTTVSRQLLETAPELEDGELDERATAQHYGLAAGEDAPETLGYGEVGPDDPAWSAERQEERDGVVPAAEQRARMREGL